MRAADYIVKTLVTNGVKHVFMITGGSAMFLNDALGLEKRIQAGEMAVVCVTSGPGGTNTLSGVLGQWMDSIPVLYLSGQVRFETTIASTDLPLRQLGDQEANIVDIVRPITKYAVMVTDPKLIRYHLEKAMHLAVSGRPGPVWLDIPLNVQSSLIEETNLKSYDPKEDAHTTAPGLIEQQISQPGKQLEHR